MEKLRVKIVNRSANPLPEYATNGSAGCDLRADIKEPVVIKSMQRVVIPTGLFIELPQGYEAQVRSRSGLTLKHGIVVANGVGTIDSDYRGEIGVLLVNISDTTYTVSPGEKIAQLVIASYSTAEFIECEALDETQRGEGGFGHSGKM